jgi:glycosyltransferase involved in cell wall biosynthesis
MNTWAEYFYGLKDVAAEYGLNVVLLNFEMGDDKRAKVPINSMFDEIIPRLDYRKYLSFLSQSMLNVDITHDKTYGRGVVDAAALGVPTIGSNTIDAARILFGDYCIDPWDTNAMDGMVQFLLDTEEEREKAATYGMKHCARYSLENSYNKMIEELEEKGLV